MRADFYARMRAPTRSSPQQVAAQQFARRADGRATRCAQAIEEPARPAGARARVGPRRRRSSTTSRDQPGALPLLEHALLELWERRRGAQLTLEGYRDSGGVRGALAQRAEEIYDGLARRGRGSPAACCCGSRSPARRPRTPVGAPRRRAATVAADAVDDVVARLVERAHADDVRAEGDERWVEVSHEALIRGWPRLRGWIDEDRAGLRVHRRLTASAEEWKARERHESLLYSGLLLAELEEWHRTAQADLNELEVEFIDASVARQRREERAKRRRRQATVATLALVIAIVGGLALWAARQAAIARAERDAALSRELAANASGELASDPQLSVLLASTALSRRSTPEAITALRDALARNHLQAVLDHEAKVNVARFDPSGRLVATGDEDGLVRLWDAASGRHVRDLAHDPDGDETFKAVRDVRFSPDGALLVSVGRLARVWDVDTGALLRTLGDADPEAFGEAFTNGRQIVIGPTSGTPVVRDAATGRLVARLRDAGGLWGNAVLSPDGRWFAAKLEDRPARLWNARTGRVVREIAPIEKSGSIWDGGAFSFSPDSRLLLVSSEAPTRLFRTGAGKAVRDYPSAGVVGDAAFAPDGRRFVTSNDRDASVWAVDSAARVSTARLPGAVSDATLSRDGRLVVTASGDGTAQISEALTGRQLAELRGHGVALSGAWFSPDGRSVVTASGDGTARLWRTTLGRPPRVLPHGNWVLSIAMTPDARSVLTGADDGQVRLWGGDERPTLSLPLGESAYDVGFRDRGRLILAEGISNAVLWDANDGRELARFPASENQRLHDVDISSDGRLAVVIADGTTTATPVAGGGRAQTLAISQDTLGVDSPTVRFSPDDKVVLITSNSVATIWDPRRGKVVAKRRHVGVTNGAVSPDGTLAATISFDAPAELWSTADGRRVALLEGGNEISQIAFSPDGRVLVGTSGEGPAVVWSGSTGRPLFELRHAVGGDTEVGFSADGRWIATAHGDGTRIWEARTGRAALDVVHRAAKDAAGDAEIAVLSRDGRWIASGGREGTAQIHECEICQPLPALEALAVARSARKLTESERLRYLHD